MLGQDILDLSMSRDWLLIPVVRVHVNVVAGSMSMKNTAGVD